MKSLFDDFPKFCPHCGVALEFDVVRRTAFENGHAQYCPSCRHKWQKVERHLAEERLFDLLDPIFTAP